MVDGSGLCNQYFRTPVYLRTCLAVSTDRRNWVSGGGLRCGLPSSPRGVKQWSEDTDRHALDQTAGHSVATEHEYEDDDTLDEPARERDSFGVVPVGWT